MAPNAKPNADDPLAIIDKESGLSVRNHPAPVIDLYKIDGMTLESLGSTGADEALHFALAGVSIGVFMTDAIAWLSLDKTTDRQYYTFLIVSIMFGMSSAYSCIRAVVARTRHGEILRKIKHPREPLP